MKNKSHLTERQQKQWLMYLHAFMIIILQVFFVLVLLVLLIQFVYKSKRAKGATQLPDHYKELLTDYVKFYSQLDEEGKKHFEERLQRFLTSVRITEANAIAEDLDKVLIAAGAIIPVYYIPDWEYINLHEVLLYPGTFNQNFDQQGMQRPILGMVGTGAMQNVMIRKMGHCFCPFRLVHKLYQKDQQSQNKKNLENDYHKCMKIHKPFYDFAGVRSNNHHKVFIHQRLIHDFFASCSAMTIRMYWRKR